MPFGNALVRACSGSIRSTLRQWLVTFEVPT